MAEPAYLIPVRFVDAYRGKLVIVRSDEPSELVSALSEPDQHRLVGVQLLSLAADPESMASWGYAVPVELVMRNPDVEFPLLYRHAKLLDKHPVRASIPVTPGFSKAVKVATSLEFAVKLRIEQPDDNVISELLSVVDFYLHQSTVSQPIEFLHGTLSAFYQRQAASLWSLLEEDPAIARYVSGDGRESIARRPYEHGAGPLEDFVVGFSTQLRAGKSECRDCEFFENCGSYFKWPGAEYECTEVKKVFARLKNAADDLRRDLDEFDQARMEAPK